MQASPTVEEQYSDAVPAMGPALAVLTVVTAAIPGTEHAKAVEETNQKRSTNTTGDQTDKATGKPWHLCVCVCVCVCSMSTTRPPLPLAKIFSFV